MPSFEELSQIRNKYHDNYNIFAQYVRSTTYAIPNLDPQCRPFKCYHIYLQSYLKFAIKIRKSSDIKICSM